MLVQGLFFWNRRRRHSGPWRCRRRAVRPVRPLLVSVTCLLAHRGHADQTPASCHGRRLYHCQIHTHTLYNDAELTNLHTATTTTTPGLMTSFTGQPG